MARLLIVEDSPEDRRHLLDLLRDRPDEVLVAADGEAAVELAVRQCPDLVLLDVLLPKKNGFQVCRELRAAAGTCEVPIVLVTGKAQDSDRYWGLEQGADDVLVKPVDRDALDHVLSRYL